MLTRREAVSAMAAAALPWTREPQNPPAPRQLKPLPFDPAKLTGLSERLITSHHQNNYSGAFRRLDQIEGMLAALPKDAPGFQLKGLKMEELIATNSVILHEKYFGNLGGDGKVSGAVQAAIVRDFGSVDRWEQDFRALSAALGGGSGWAILGLSFRDGRLHNSIAFDHTDNVTGAHPILVNDMFEHSYHMDFGTQVARYVDAFMKNVNWEECSRRFEDGQKAAALFRS